MVLPPLVNLIAVLAAAGSIVGAIVGFSIRLRGNADWVKNMVDGAQLGAVAGSAIAFAIWIGGSAAGG